MRGHVVVGELHPIPVVDGFAPIIRGIAAVNHGLEAATLHTAGGFAAREVDQGGSEVDVGDHGVADESCFDGRRITHDKGHAEGLFIHPTFVVVVVLTGELALVGGVENDGIVEFAGGLEVVDEATDVVIHAPDAAEVFFQVTLVGGGFVGFRLHVLIHPHLHTDVALQVSFADRGAETLGAG